MLQSLQATTTEPHAATTEACMPGACAPQQEKPQQKAWTPQRSVAPAHLWRKPECNNEVHHSQKIK